MRKVFAVIVLSACAMGMFGCNKPPISGGSGGVGSCVCGVPNSACGSC